MVVSKKQKNKRQKHCRAHQQGASQEHYFPVDMMENAQPLVRYSKIM